MLITNAFNLIDGLDGLSGGPVFIAGLTLPAVLRGIVRREKGKKGTGYF